MWTGACFRVPLETESPAIVQLDTLQATVKQRAVCGSNILRQRFLMQSETMVLTGNQNLFRSQILNRVIGTVMAKFHLDG